MEDVFFFLFHFNPNILRPFFFSSLYQHLIIINALFYYAFFAIYNYSLLLLNIQDVDKRREMYEWSDFRDLIPIRDILIPPLVWVKMNVKVEWGSNGQTRSERGIRNKYDNFELFNNKILRLRNSWTIEMINFWYLFGL